MNNFKMPGNVKVTNPADLPTGGRKIKVLFRLWRYMGRYWYGYLAAFLLNVIANLLALEGPKLSGFAISAIEPGTGRVDFDTVVHYCILMALLYVLSSVLSYVQQILMIHLSRGIVRQMRSDIFAKLMRMRVEYFDKHPSGDIISRISYDIDTLNATLSTDLIQVCSSVITVTGSLIMMLSISPRLCLIFAFTVPIAVVTTWKMAGMFRPLFRARSGKLGELNGYAEEQMSGQKTVRAYSMEPNMIRRFAAKNKIAADAYYNADYHGTLVGPTVNLINNISLTLVSVFGCLLYMNGAIHLGDVSSFVLYSRKFSGPINETANIVNELQSAAAAAERVFRLLDAPEEVPDLPDAVRFGRDGVPVHGHVETHAVQFGYDPAKTIIHDLTIDVKPGTTVAIVGPTGAGKTTIINLIMRFYDPDSGTIRLEGYDTKSAVRSTLRRSFTMVLQDTWLFSGTIAENIAYGADHPVTRVEVERAAVTAGIDSFIRSLPQGYDTPLVDEGVNISKGQKQLLTIARAMVSDAPVLILDEATSHVDSMTEMRIQEAMRHLMLGRTAFVIAHRLSTVRDADCILVLREGRVIESGTHDALMEKKGFYYSLHNSQYDG